MPVDPGIATKWNSFAIIRALKGMAMLKVFFLHLKVLPGEQNSIVQCRTCRFMYLLTQPVAGLVSSVKLYNLYDRFEIFVFTS